MVSNSSKTALRRRLKNRKQGRERKRKLEREGSTPKFPIHPEGKKATAAKPAAAKKPATKKPATKKPAAETASE